jgi:hypothetical protein
MEKATATLEQVIKTHPDDAEARFNLGTAYAKQGPALGRQEAMANFKAKCAAGDRTRPPAALFHSPPWHYETELLFRPSPFLLATSPFASM